MYKFEKSLGRLSQQVSKALGRRLEERFMIAGKSINGTEWSIISMLKHKGCTTQLCIGTTLEMDKVSLTRALSSLEKMNLLSRSPLKDDLRINEVSLSVEGERVYSSLAPLAEDTLNEAFRGIDSREADLLMSLLERVHRNLNHR